MYTINTHSIQSSQHKVCINNCFRYRNKISFLFCIAMIACCIGCNKSKPEQTPPEQVDNKDMVNPDIEQSGAESGNTEVDNKEMINPDDEPS